MCRVLYRSLKFTVELSLSFCFIPEVMENSVVRLSPGFCWNHCTRLTVAEKLHLRVELAPSWSFKTEGLCSTFTLLTPAWKEKNKHMMSLRGHGWGFQTRKVSQEHLRMKDHLGAPGQLSPLPPTDSCGHSPAPSLGWPRLTANLDPQNPQKGSPLSLHDPLPRYWGAFAPTLKDIESWGQRNAVLTASVFHQNHWVPIASEVCQLT